MDSPFTSRCAEGEDFEFNEAQEQELLEAMAEADRGDVIDADQFLRDLRARR